MILTSLVCEGVVVGEGVVVSEGVVVGESMALCVCWCKEECVETGLRWLVYRHLFLYCYVLLKHF